jgi:hypothetical protein
MKDCGDETGSGSAQSKLLAPVYLLGLRWLSGFGLLSSQPRQDATNTIPMARVTRTLHNPTSCFSVRIHGRTLLDCLLLATRSQQANSRYHMSTDAS